MTRADAWILGKKILLGIVITIVPLAILAGGLWVTQRVVGNHAHAKQVSSTRGVSYAN
jgi:hypothetical protein